MITLDRVARLAKELPEVGETQSRGHRAWTVAGKNFAWERPFTKADVKRFGDEPVPEGEILALRTSDLAEKEALLTAHPTTCFSTPHFDGYPSILVQLYVIKTAELRELLLDAWLACAPTALAERHLHRQARGRS